MLRMPKNDTECITLFWTNFDPLTSCHTLSHISGPGDPLKYVTYLGSPIFVVHAYVGLHMSLQGVCLSSRGFCPGIFVWKVLSGVVFVHIPSVRTHPSQHKTKHHLQF